MSTTTKFSKPVDDEITSLNSKLTIQSGDEISLSNLRCFGVYESSTELRIFVPLEKKLKSGSLSISSLTSVEVYCNGTDTSQNISSSHTKTVTTVGDGTELYITIKGTFSNASNFHPCICVFNVGAKVIVS